MQGKFQQILLLLIIFSFNFLYAQHKDSKITKLSGPYLGQNSPGLSPEKFAPEIITTASNEAYASFSDNGNELYFKCTDKGGWLFTKMDNNHWTEPMIIPYSREYRFGEANVAVDGNALLFCSSYSAKDAGGSNDLNLWMMKKKDGIWMTPEIFGKEINSEMNEAFPTLSASGDLYFFRELENERGCEIFVSKFINGKYSTGYNLGPLVNSDKHDCDPCLAPDGSYLIFCVRDRKEGLGKNDLYISFLTEEGNWSQSMNMGEVINSEAEEITPHISPDGKYLFYASNREGNYDIYWVDTKILDNLNNLKKVFLK